MMLRNCWARFKNTRFLQELPVALLTFLIDDLKKSTFNHQLNSSLI